MKEGNAIQAKLYAFALRIVRLYPHSRFPVILTNDDFQ